ncbi:MAG: desulfoferrodoxin [Oscillospiraceae bacterium]|nr:desulfoferrodoxin [Oscillospiraceae bacterium]
MNEQKFYRCSHCGNLIGLIDNGGVPMICCGEPMEELVANSVEAATEKHVPSVSVQGDTVTVQIGSVAHPMLAEHHITFIYLHTQNGGQRKALCVGAEPKATFRLIDDTPLEAYAYCNLHGLWKAKI